MIKLFDEHIALLESHIVHLDTALAQLQTDRQHMTHIDHAHVTEMRQTATGALADARRCRETLYQYRSSQSSAIRRKPLPSDDLDALPSKRAKITPDRPSTVSFTTTPSHSKRASEESSPTSSQPSKRARVSEPRQRHDSQNDLQRLSAEPDRFHAFPPMRKPHYSNPISPALYETLTPPDTIVEEDVDDIEAEVDRRLEQNERRRKERMGEKDRLNEIRSSAKRKRVSGDSTSSIEGTSETVGALEITKKGRKRLRKRIGQANANNEAEQTKDRNSKTQNRPEGSTMSENKGKRRISAIFDGTGDQRQDFEPMDKESRRRRKKIALTGP